jgi:hypothetical protein
MDYRDYKELYQALLSAYGRGKLGNDPAQQDVVVAKINDFLKKYPTVIPADKNPQSTVVQLSMKEIFRRTINITIDILNDVSDTFSKRPYISSTEFRRDLFKAFTREDRRLYVGFLLVFFSFILYFIDSTA